MNICPLSKRELDVVREVAAGKSAKEAARDLSISHNVVTNYLQIAKLKCGTGKNVTGLVAKAVREGWV